NTPTHFPGTVIAMIKCKMYYANLKRMKTERTARNRSLTFIAGLVMCILSSTAFAQEPQQPQPPAGFPEESQEPSNQYQTPQETPQAPDTQAPELREDYSDAELESFVNANKKVATIQEETEAMIIGQIEEKGMTVDRFNEILASQQDPAKKDSVQATAEELAAFNEIATSIVS